MVHADGSVVETFQFFKDQGFQGFKDIWPKPTATAAKIILCFGLFEAALQLFLPGNQVQGPISPMGNRPLYKANGLLAYAVTLITYLGLWWSGVFNPAVVYDHLGEIFSTLIFGSFVFCIFLYLKGHLAPSSTDSGSSGNAIIDFYWTIAVIQAGHGLLQLGSSKIIPEDLHFVLPMTHTFESLGYQSEDAL